MQEYKSHFNDEQIESKMKTLDIVVALLFLGIVFAVGTLAGIWYVGSSLNVL